MFSSKPNELTVSVIIPSYNPGDTILRALHSVFMQTRQPDEVIVVDDGSTDNSAQLVKKFYPSVKLIQIKNSGVSAARNTGVKNSSGMLLAFLDADDFWHSKKLEYQLSIFEKFPDVSICSTKYISFELGEEFDYKKACTYNIEELSCTLTSFNQFIQHPFLATPSVILKRELFDKVGGFNEQLKIAEDIDLWLKCTYSAKYFLVHNRLTFVVKQPGSLSALAGSKDTDLLPLIETFLETNKVSFLTRNVAFRITKAKVRCVEGSSLLSANDYIKAIQKLLLSILYYPRPRTLFLLGKSVFLSLITFGLRLR